ncbi:aminotransferase class I/II-fold pyridoxal phosphate-dependent enzyme [Streptomyces sp. AK04-3B]|uniref:aminotransferase class I/II-fold pyridoxal phosphate-dependent enzyme n=1 Tax=unclassified Streptomyces TaxID=2593676 RepID=UPI0029AA8A3F|nr:aminotransferase class I/II-fold pyridoxal phosphate-dependent enzyme [Streptomyces sp. AK04-3B]MDX3802066.1 aminotransferase class I/II-fold pyridoxal phosphate-dependent enzyme [Streptomyces sp. AK04-3B]
MVKDDDSLHDVGDPVGAAAARTRATVRLPDDTTSEHPVGTDAETIDLSFAAPAAPVEILHAAFATALEQLPRHFERHGYDRYGTAELRQAVAHWYQRRGLPTRPDHILVTNGAQHALALLTRIFLSPCDTVLIDHPTYPHAITTFSQARARLLPVAVTSSGWDTSNSKQQGKPRTWPT